MIDIKFLRENPEAVKENIKKRSFRMKKSYSLTRLSSLIKN